MRIAILSLLLALVAACDRDADPLDLSAAKVAPRAVFDARSQLDLARALDDIERGDRDEAGPRYDEVVRSFEGKRYRWRVKVLAPLCRADRCNVLAFDRGGRGVVGQSWMPRLELEPDQHRALVERCAGESPCSVELEGRMARLIASTEQFTSVTFDRVELVH
jgi:hypothetical protein